MTLVPWNRVYAERGDMKIEEFGFDLCSGNGCHMMRSESYTTVGSRNTALKNISRNLDVPIGPPVT